MYVQNVAVEALTCVSTLDQIINTLPTGISKGFITPEKLIKLNLKEKSSAQARPQ